MAKKIKPGAFDEAAQRYFGFLLQCGFVGPDVKEYWLVFTSETLAIQIFYDDHDGRVSTTILGDQDDRASLDCLYVEAGLGPAQRIRDIARSVRTLETALESQSSALRELLPLVKGEEGAVMLAKCHGR